MEASAATRLNKPTTLVDSVEEYLYGYITNNHLRPGDHLPAEEDFSNSLGVSRNIVREAISRLKSFGYVSSRRRGGLIVTSANTGRDFGRMLIPQLMDEMTVANVLELRITLEEGIAETLLKRITPEDIAELEEIIVSEGMDFDGVNSTVEAEIKFHGRIFQMSGNSVLVSLHNALLPVYQYAKEHPHEFDAYNKALDSTVGKASHKDIIAALKSGDPNIYKGVIRRHLYAYCEFVRSMRKNNPVK